GEVYRVTPRSDVRTFHDAPYLFSDGQLYWADPLPVSFGRIGNRQLGPTPTNPAGVYYHTGNLTLNGNVRIHGTLVVRNGSLTLAGLNNHIDATLSHSLGFPALVVDGSILPALLVLGQVLEVDGVTW